MKEGENVHGVLKNDIDIERSLGTRQIDNSVQSDLLFALLPNIKEAVIVIDKDKRILFMNSAAESLIDCDFHRAKGEKLEQHARIFSTDNKEEFLEPKIKEEVVRQGKLKNLSMILQTAPKFSKRITLSVLPLSQDITADNGYVLLMSDDTLFLQMQQELLKPQEYEAIKFYIAGIVHDFNSMLTIILGNISLANLSLTTTGKISQRVIDWLNKAEEGCSRAHKVALQLMNYSKKSSLNKYDGSVKEIIEEVVGFFGNSSSVKCNCTFTGSPCKVDIDIAKITRVINNLVQNAMESMPFGGNINIVTENTDVSKDSQLPLPEGQYLKISIADTGNGIPDEFKEKVFKPFFTGKEHGNGLGLIISKKIIDEHKGYITFDSEVGKGTTFQILLPACKSYKSDGQQAISAF